MRTYFSALILATVILGPSARCDAASRAQAGAKKCSQPVSERKQALNVQIAGVEGNIQLMDLKIGALREKLRDAVAQRVAAKAPGASTLEQEAFQREMAAEASAEELAELDEQADPADRDSLKKRENSSATEAETEAKIKWLNDGKAGLQERLAVLQKELSVLPKSCK